MKDAATIAHPQPPSRTLVDEVMVLMLMGPDGICYSFYEGEVPKRKEEKRKKNVNVVFMVVKCSFFFPFLKKKNMPYKIFLTPYLLQASM